MRHTARAIIIKDKKVLLVTGHGKSHYWTPGGKLEDGESSVEALHREIKEELGVLIKSYEPYASYEFKNQKVDNFLIEVEGKITPGREISEAIWYDSISSVNISLGFKQKLLPRLIERGLIT